MKIFDSIKIKAHKRNKFDLSHERKLSFRMGDLIPILVQPILPGDKWRANTEVFIRMAPLLAPVMHKVTVTTHSFFVPYRLIWDEWEDFITGGVDGTHPIGTPHFEVTTEFVLPGWCNVGGLWDYMGYPIIPTGTTIAQSAYPSSLPFRAYQLIFNEYYRDQTLVPEVEIPKTSGPDNAEATDLLTMRKRAWEKDYFTSALPFAQRGDQVLVPTDVIADQVRVKATGSVPVTGIGDPISYDNTGQIILNPDSAPIEGEIRGSNASTTINDLRRAIRIQEWMETAAVAGSRYVEQLKAFFGVRSSDARMQRPEYLGGGKQIMNISEVLSTFQDTAGTGAPQGNMAGHGASYGNRHGFSRFFEEHGIVMTVMSVIPKTSYQQGFPREWLKYDKFEFGFPQLANIGEQAILNSEVYYDWTPGGAPPEGEWGYQSRYAEYKYIPDSVHGEFRDTLKFWHMGRIFDEFPNLNGAFVTSNPTERIFPTEDPVDQMYCQVYHKIDALRQLPYYGTPSL